MKRFLLHLKRPKYFDIYKPKQSQYYDQNGLVDQIYEKRMFSKKTHRVKIFGTISDHSEFPFIMSIKQFSKK